MPKAPSTIAVVLVGLTLSGCASQWPNSVSPDAKQMVVETPTRSPAVADPQQLQNVAAELQQLGPIEPAAHDRLIADLQRSDPAIWPLVFEQFRATQAYRRQAMQRNGIPEYVRRVPTVIDPARPPKEPSQGDCPDFRVGNGAVPLNSPSSAQYPSTSASGDVAPASYLSPTTSNWRLRLDEAIEALEAETPVNPATPGELAQHARLRLLYAAAGRREDAVRPIPDASLATQQFLSKELEGLGAWLDADRVPDAARRAAEAKPALTEALAKLGETAPLLIRNAALCSEVLAFARVKRLDKNELLADQQVLLYAELENFVSEPTSQGFRTSLRSAYQIIDELGRQVVGREFPATTEHCKSVRRDFFVSYQIRLPKRIDPGKYMLRLLIQDTTSQKTGQASIEFTVKSAAVKTEKPKATVA